MRKRNAMRKEKLAEERAVLRRLPARRLESFREEFPKVSRWSTVRVAKRTYSVPSRLIGERLIARVHAETIELEYKGQVIESMERLRGGGTARIDYRHVIESLVCKPGAFALYRFQESLFPSVVFRRTYDALREGSANWADLEYVRILQLAARTLESKVEAVLSELLDREELPEYDTVKALVDPEEATAVPQVAVIEADLGEYDALLATSCLREEVA